MIYSPEDDVRGKGERTMEQQVKIGVITVRPEVRSGAQTGRWVVDIPSSLTGQRKRPSRSTKKKAVELARRLKRELENKKLGLMPTVRSTSKTFNDVVKEWVTKEGRRVQTRKKEEGSLRRDKDQLKPICRFLGSCLVQDVSADKVIDYQILRLDSGMSPYTVNSEVATIKKVLRWAIEQKWLDKMPKIESIPEPKLNPDLPDPSEIREILDAICPSARPVVWFVAETGCRSGEAFNLRWEDVNTDSGWVQIQRQEEWTPKTSGSERKLQITGGLLEAVRDLPKIGKYVFPSRSDPNRPRDNVRKALASAVTKAGLKVNGRPMVVTMKTFRKCFATFHANSKTPQRVLQELMGHVPGSRVTNASYVKATEEALLEATLKGVLPETVDEE
jgi:integrase